MKRIVIYISTALAVMLCSVSCLKTDFIVSSGTLICTLVNTERFLSDAGEYMNVTEIRTSAVPDSLKRLVINCDVIAQHEDAENEFDIRLLGFAPVTIAEPVLASESEGTEPGVDALDATLWVSGGYLNSLVSYSSLSDSRTEHAINLVLDDTKSGSDTLFMKVTHNAFGESYDNPDVDVSKITDIARYFSYDLHRFIPSGKQSVILHIEYEAFVTSDGAIMRDKTLRSGDLQYFR